jgi:hypothetical protein
MIDNPPGLLISQRNRRHQPGKALAAWFDEYTDAARRLHSPVGTVQGYGQPLTAESANQIIRM